MKKEIRFFTAAWACLFSFSIAFAAPDPGDVVISELKPISEMASMVPGAIYADPQAPASERAHDLIRRMSFEEKLDLTGGWNKFLVHGVDRLGIRPVSMADASQGIRVQTALIKTPSTSFPGMLPMASTWDREIIAEMASAIAQECRQHGVDILLGPGINLQRLSVGGRNYEYFGEDPFLTGSLAASYIKALQAGGVIACPKHFIGNDQDFCRHIVNITIDERTLREIYLLPWEMAIKEAGVLSTMTANNSTNGFHNIMNRDLLQRTLRDDFGFKGFIMTDWQNSGYFPKMQQYVLTAGGNLMMPVNDTFKKYILSEAAKSQERKDEIEIMLEKMIYPTFYALFEMGIYDRPLTDPEAFKDTKPHEDLARRCATESMVLLKNDKGILPIKDSYKKILFTGAEESSSGTGSGHVVGYNHVSFEDGLKAEFGDRLICDREPSDKTVKSADLVLFCINKPAGEGFDVPFDKASDQVETLKKVLKLNRNVVVLVSACNSLPTDWVKSARGVVWCYFEGQQRGAALASLLSGRENFSGKLPFTLEKNWADTPDPEFNFIGGAPYWQGNNQYKAYWLGGDRKAAVKGFSEFIEPGEVIQRSYKEGIFMGYRWADKTGMPCAWRFGDGLSYTSFKYEKMEVSGDLEKDGRIEVNITVRNTGKRDGAEIVQLYVSDPVSSVKRPVKELKGFARVNIPAGGSATVTIPLGDRSFSFWDESTHAWKLEPGEFVLRAGGSSSSLPLSCTVAF